MNTAAFHAQASDASEVDAGLPVFDAMAACKRIVDGNATAEDQEWVRRGFDALLSNMGAVPLERCLRLPNSYAAWAKLSRDQWLCKAVSFVDADSSWSAAQKLDAAWTRFIDRGHWKQWRSVEHPPELAGEFDVALFYATKLNNSKGLNAKQISRIVGHFFHKKSL